MTDKLKVIFDTDPGIDDAMAMLFAHASDKIDLLGITTVLGNATIENATRNAQLIKAMFGLTATIAKGADKPLVIEAEPPTTFVHGDNGLGDIEIPDIELAPIDERHACDYIIDMVHQYPNQICLIAVGRLTNIALAMTKDPSIIPLVKQVIIMGGAMGHNGHTGNVSPFAEANIIGDPHAADMVFGANWPLTMVGLDVTQEVRMNSDYLQQLVKHSGAGQFIWDITRFYQEFHTKSAGLDCFYVHDSSAIAYAIAPELFETKQGPIRVLTEGPAMGYTLMKSSDRWFPVDGWQDRPAQTACIGVNGAAFLDLYFNTLANI